MLKKWEKTKFKDNIYWRKNYNVISVSKIEKGSNVWDREKAKYSFSTNKGDKIKYFKTKSQSLKYARIYMRKH